MPSTRSSPQLEGLAQREAEAGQGTDLLGVGAAEGRADVQRALDGVLRRLVAQHRHGGVDVGAATGLGRDVEELAGDDLAAGEVEEPQRVQHPLGGQAAGAQQLVGPAEEQVAEQDRGRGAVVLPAAGPAVLAVLLLEGPVGRGVATAGVGGVHQVVVDQRAGVEQLQGAAGADECVVVPGRGRAGDGVVAPPAEGGPQPLAAGDAGARVGHQTVGVGPQLAQPRGLLVDEADERGLQP